MPAAMSSIFLAPGARTSNGNDAQSWIWYPLRILDSAAIGKIDAEYHVRAGSPPQSRRMGAEDFGICGEENSVDAHAKIEGGGPEA